MAASPRATPRGGVHEQTVAVTLAASEPGVEVHYTLDGSIPTQQHSVYDSPIPITNTSVLRFRSFRRGFLPSDTVTETYVIGRPPKLPVVAIAADPLNLWNKYSGIYENMYRTGPKWERDAEVQVFAAGHEALRIPGRIRIHGGASRGKPKKSFRFRFRTTEATGPSYESLWTWRSPAAERTVVIRAGGSNVLYRLRDELFHATYGEAGGFTSTFEPAFVYLNGQPWGIYDVREYIDDEYLQRHVGPGTYDLIVDQGIRGDVVTGDREHWDATMRYFETTSFSSEVEVRRAAELVDLENLTDYWLFNIYAANLDWPHHNVFTFRSRDGADRRWKWIAWDADATFDYQSQGLTHDTLAWATRDRLRHDLRFNNAKGLLDSERNLAGTLIMRRLLRNEAFKARVATRLRILLDTAFQPERMEAHLDRIVASVLQDLPRDWERWEIEPAAYWRNVTQIREFIRRRPAIVAAQAASHFGNAWALSNIDSPR